MHNNNNNNNDDNNNKIIDVLSDKNNLMYGWMNTYHSLDLLCRQ